MKRPYVFCAGAVSGLLFTAGVFAGVVNVSVNGSFETPSGSGQFQPFSKVAGWRGSAGNEVQVNGRGGAGRGIGLRNEYAELAVEKDSTYARTIATAPGGDLVNFEQFTQMYVASSTQSVVLFTPRPGGGELLDPVTLRTDIGDGVGGPSNVPIPPAFWTGMSGLLGLIVIGMFRKLGMWKRCQSRFE